MSGTGGRAQLGVSRKKRSGAPPRFLVVDKPAGPTSHDVVAIVRSLLAAKRVGHTGTLDPFATGVLPVAIGGATRLISLLDEDIKVYEARLKLGQATLTGDTEAEPVVEAPVPPLEDGQIDAVLAGLLGEQDQVAPLYSAVKVAGRPLYSYARSGEPVERPVRRIRIDQLTCTDRGPDWLDLSITCGRGTYIRAIAESVAAALGTVGHLVALRRTRSGPFTLEGAATLPGLARIASDEDLHWKAILKPEQGAPRVRWRDRSLTRAQLLAGTVGARFPFQDLPLHGLSAVQADHLLATGVLPEPPPEVSTGSRYVAVDARDGRMLALAERRATHGQPLRVIPRVPGELDHAETTAHE